MSPSFTSFACTGFFPKDIKKSPSKQNLSDEYSSPLDSEHQTSASFCIRERCIKKVRLSLRASPLWNCFVDCPYAGFKRRHLFLPVPLFRRQVHDNRDIFRLPYQNLSGYFEEICTKAAKKALVFLNIRDNIQDQCIFIDHELSFFEGFYKMSAKIFLSYSGLMM